MITRTDDRVFINNLIRAPKVLVIDDEGKNIGILNTYDAIKMALDKGLDLLQIAPPTKDKPPTTKILDYGKYRFDQSKKVKAAEKKQRESEIKTHEIKFRPTTGPRDLEIKAKKAKEFLADGDKLKVTIMFRGREMSHREVAFQTLEEFMALIPNAIITSQPSTEGSKSITVMVGIKEEKQKQAL